MEITACFFGGLTKQQRNKKGNKEMGQYHKLINLDKREQVNPYPLDLGAKQYEQTGTAGDFGDALYLLLMSSPNRGGGDWDLFPSLSGRWVGDRVIVLGDYTEDGDLPNYPNASKLYSESKDWADISSDVAQALNKVYERLDNITAITNY